MKGLLPGIFRQKHEVIVCASKILCIMAVGQVTICTFILSTNSCTFIKTLHKTHFKNL